MRSTSSTAPLATPSANQGLFEVFRRRYLLKLLVRREIAARYQGSFLGLLWSYINPLSQFFIYWFVIGYIMGTHKNVENFPVHIFAGLIVVHFFTETFNAGTRSIVRNKSLVKKMARAPRDLPGRLDARVALPRRAAAGDPGRGLPLMGWSPTPWACSRCCWR